MRSVSLELAVRLFLVSLLHSMEKGISDRNITEGAGVSQFQYFCNLWIWLSMWLACKSSKFC